MFTAFMVGPLLPQLMTWWLAVQRHIGQLGYMVAVVAVGVVTDVWTPITLM